MNYLFLKLPNLSSYNGGQEPSVHVLKSEGSSSPTWTCSSKEPVPSAPQDATELALKPGRGGIVPPAEHRFKPGAEWRGNKGGRPRILREETAKWLAERDETGKTNAQKAIESVGAVAQSGTKNSASALKALDDMLGDDDDQKADRFNVGSLHMDLLALLQTIPIER